MQAIDIGNAFTLSFNGKHYNEMRSVITTVPSRVNYYTGGGRIEYQGSLYHVGENVFRYPDFRLLAENDKQVDLTDNVLLVLSVLPIKQRVGDISPIVLQVPSLLNSYQHELVKELNGVHSWIMDGKQYTTRIEVQNVYQEGYGSWFMAKRSKLLPDNGYSLVLDIGGGTSIVSMIDNESGEVMPNVNTYGKRGVIGLVNMLRGDLELRLKNNNDIPSVDQLFVAIEDRTFQIGNTGASFKEQYDFHTRAWFDKLFKSNVVNDYQQFFTRRQITKILITGGGAEIVRPMIEAAQSKPGVGKLFAIANQPLLDNITGIYHAASQM